MQAEGGFCQKQDHHKDAQEPYSKQRPSDKRGGFAADGKRKIVQPMGGGKASSEPPLREQKGLPVVPAGESR